jgi:hypothetical protein
MTKTVHTHHGHGHGLGLVSSRLVSTRLDSTRHDTTRHDTTRLQWRVWLKKLINRNVKEIIVCGRWLKSSMKVLPNNLVHWQTLEKVHLCFFSFPPVTCNLHLLCLQELELLHCVFDSSDLEAILRSCKLIRLTLGYVKLGILRIQSESLRYFTMWSCNIDIRVWVVPQVLHSSDKNLGGLGTTSLTFKFVESRICRLLSIYLNEQTIELCGYLIKV